MNASMLRCCRWLLGLALTATVFAQTPTQRPSPRIGYVYPAGGRQGTTVRVSVGGQNLGGANAVYFSGRGLQANVVDYQRPMTQGEFNQLREKVQALQEKKAAARKESAAGDKKGAWTAADEAMLTELRQKMQNRPNRQASPAIAETVTIEVTFAADALPGEHELRVKATAGLSNPVAFWVGQLPEFTEPVTVPTTPQPELLRRGAAGGGGVRSQPAREITLPAIANGQILPGEVDRLRFAGRKGQRITIAVSARALIPYLADAVPGWFQATLSLSDAAGRELSYSDDFRFNPDPVVMYELPADGEYTVAIKDSIYRGREDFVYRVALGELPFVTSIFPLGTPPTKQSAFELEGWNLRSQQLAVDTTARGAGIYLLAVRNDGSLSNQVRFAVDPDPTLAEVEPNDTPAAAQRVAFPQVIDGRIQRSGDEDVFRFEGKARQEIVAEIFARRLNSPLDSVLELTSADGKRLAFNDDHEDKRSGLNTHHADSRLGFTLPADGSYFVRVADAQRGGGSEFGYRLRLGAPRPDFDLRIVPASINARAGGNVPITVYALRHDGFNGEILLSLKDAPRGLALSGARIPPGRDKVELTLSAPPVLANEPFDILLAGKAMIGGNAVTHIAVPAEDMMQAFAYRHLVAMRELKVMIGSRGSSARVVTKTPVELPLNGRARLTVSMPSVRGASAVRVELSDPPAGVTVASAKASGESVMIELACDATAKTALEGNLILHVYGERENRSAPKGKKAAARSFLGTLPAVPFVIPAVTTAGL